MMCDNQYIFISRDSNSSVYRALGQYLLNIRKDEWKKAKPDSRRFNLMLGDRNKLPYARLGQAPGFQQLVNYYRGSESICRKCSFVREMKRHCLSRNIGLFPWFPKSFIVIPKRPSTSSYTVSTTLGTDAKIDLVEQNMKTNPVSGVQDSNENIFQNMDDRQELLEYCSSSSENQIWIAKSSSGAKGDGIKISGDIEYLLDYIDHQHQSYIIQKYLHNPFLLNHQRKFDIRYLLKTRGETMEARIIPQIKDIIKSTFNIILENVDTTGLDYKSFQLFGFDFLLDDTLKVWLLEINGAPACAQKLLPDLVESLVKTAIDPVFKTSYTAVSSSLFHFDLLES